MLHCKKFFPNKSFSVKSFFLFLSHSPFCGILRSYGFFVYGYFSIAYFQEVVRMEWTFSDSVRLSLLSFSEASKACAALPDFLFSGAVCSRSASNTAAQSCCLTAWSDRLPSRTRRIRFTLHSRLRFISTGGSLFWQPTNRHFRLCRASSSRKNRSILPMSSTCFSRFWNR